MIYIERCWTSSAPGHPCSVNGETLLRKWPETDRLSADAAFGTSMTSNPRFAQLLDQLPACSRSNASVLVEATLAEVTEGIARA